MTVHPVLASSTGTQTLEGRGEEKGMGNVYKTRVRIREKPPVHSIIQSSPPLFAIQVCIPAEVGKVRVKRDVYGMKLSWSSRSSLTISVGVEGCVSFKKRSCCSGTSEEWVPTRLALAHIVAETLRAWLVGNLSVPPPSRLAFRIRAHS